VDGHRAGEASHGDRLRRRRRRRDGRLLHEQHLHRQPQRLSADDCDVAVIVVLRHEATTFAYNDAMWAKYGSVLGGLGKIVDPRTNQPPTVNPLNSRDFGPAMTNTGVTASAVTGRGAHFAICDMATNRIAGVIASAVKATPPEIYKELVGQPPPERPHRGSRRGGSESGAGTWLHDAERWIAQRFPPT
jgi:hypothetical protein